MESAQIVESTDHSSLKEVLSAAAADELTESFFSDVARAAFLDEKRFSEFEDVLANWDSVAASFGASRAVTNLLLGYLQYLRGNWEQAEKRFGDDRKSPWGCYFYTWMLIQTRRYDEALTFLDDACKKFSDLIPLLYARVEVLCITGREENAAKLVEQVKTKDGDSWEWAFASGYCSERAGEYRAAIESYREAVKRNPQAAKAWFRLGYLLDFYGTTEEEENDEGIKAYETCLEIVPLHTNAIINLGLLYEDRERYHDAAKCYEAVLRANPNHLRAKLYLGDAVAATRMFYDREQEKKADRHSQVLKIPVTDFELSVRSRNCLQKMNIETLGDLIMKTEQELLSYKNFGETSLKEIKDMLSQKGLRLGQGLEDKGREPPSGRNPLEATAPPEVLGKLIEDLNLSVRSRRCMERLEVHALRNLINKTEVELMSAKNFGMTSLNEIKRKLGGLGLSLKILIVGLHQPEQV